MRFIISVYLLHNLENNNGDSTKLGTFEAETIQGIKEQVVNILKQSDLQLIEYRDFIEYYAVLKVNGSQRGNIVDVCINDHYSLKNEIELEFK